MDGVERKYRYRRLAPGVALLPANDGKTMLAIARYTDGPSLGLENELRDFTAWGWGRIPDKEWERISALAKFDPDRAVDALREWGSDNRWPRHKTMREAMAYAIASTSQR